MPVPAGRHGCIHFSTYFAIASFSRLTVSPTRRSERVVSCAVWGMMETEKSSRPMDATVRLIPSMATEPFSTM